jgi:uncharacterized protein
MTGSTTDTPERARRGTIRMTTQDQGEDRPGRDERPSPPVVRCLVVKLAARCNINCRYCYWFRDPSVYSSPKLLEVAAERSLLEKLERHITRFALPEFEIVLHGGEPLLLGLGRTRSLIEAIRRVEVRSGCRIRIGVTTNGLLIDQGWAILFRDLDVEVTVSLDGDEAAHDRARVDLRGGGTFSRVVEAIAELRRAGIEPGILAVSNPSSDPAAIHRFFLDEMRIRSFDVLIPDATHEDQPPRIAPYLRGLFDAWYDDDDHGAVSIGLIEGTVLGLLGHRGQSPAIGPGPVTAATMLTDGALEAVDTLRIAGEAFTASAINVQTHEIQDIESDELWSEIVRATEMLHPTCRACEFRDVCGGGPIASRYSEIARYDNPSVYCDDLKEFFRHARRRIEKDLFVDD